MLIVMVLVAVLVISGAFRAKLVPGRWQGFWELVLETILNTVEASLGRTKTARRLFVLIATLFIFILVANWFSLLPGVGTIGFFEREITAGKETDRVAAGGYALTLGETELRQAASESSTAVAKLDASSALKINQLNGEWAQVTEVPELVKGGQEFTPMTKDGKEIAGFVQVANLSAAKTAKIITPIIRPANADLNMTLAMALIAVITANVVAIISHGVRGWLKEFFPKPYVMDPLLTPIEIIGQFSRIVSLTFRLFGNIFAGEALLAVILQIAAPILVIFLALELFFGFIQAFVFASLTLAYISLAVAGVGESHGHEGEHEAGPHEKEGAHGEAESVGVL